MINREDLFCTRAGPAARHMVHCDYRDDEWSRRKQLVMVRLDTPGMNIGGDWDTLGMRATVSPACLLRAAW